MPLVQMGTWCRDIQTDFKQAGVYISISFMVSTFKLLFDNSKTKKQA